jgi:uncharacterized small protein (TIGR04563 family)
MPAHIHLIRIDVHVDEAPPALQPILAEVHEDLDSTNHTLRTFTEGLELHAAAHPELVVDALIDDGYNGFTLLRARGGRVEVQQVEERPEGASDPVNLPYDQLATVTIGRDREAITAMLDELGEELEDPLTLPTLYDSEDQLRAFVHRVAAAAIGSGGGSFIAEAGDARFMVEIAAGRSRVAKLVVVTEPELFARLMRGDYAPAPAAARQPDGKYEQELYWPETMLRFIQEQATRTDRSLSWIVQRAFKETHGAIAESERDKLERALEPFRGGDKRKQPLYFPGAMLDAMEAEAKRLDSSLSFVMLCAVALARESIVAMPESTGFPEG